ncbi:MAG: hypothetical protein ACI4MS_02955 [Candidatus Coproplasma sp.]
MSKAKSVVITVFLALVMAVAAFFAFVSFPGGNAERYNSFLSNIHLGADFTGYAYTTIYPEGVYTAEEYNGYVEDYNESQEGENPATAYTKVGGLYVKNETHSDLDELKKQVAEDAESLNKRFGEKGYSSYSVAVEDGISIKISVPTNFNTAEYAGNDGDSRATTLSSASYSIQRLIYSGELTLRTTDSTKGIGTKDERTDTATLDDGSKTYSLSDADVCSIFKSIKGSMVGSTPVITFNFTKEGRAEFKSITTKVAASSDQTLYFFIGDKQVVGFSECTSAIDRSSLQLTTTDGDMAEDIGITLNSAVHGNDLKIEYRDIENIITSNASYGDVSALLMFISCLIVFAGLCVALTVKYKKLGAVTSAIAFLFMLVEIYALYLLEIQVTIAVAFVCLLLMGLYVLSNVIVYSEVKRLTSVGRTVQASVKDAYKNVIMTVTDLHIVLLVLAILLATVGVGEVACCGLISLIGVVASYVLYWFTRFMWYVTSSPEKDKFKFAGLKRVVYEDD